MDLGLSGRRALVAAASSGLGAAIAEALAAEGCVVEICSSSADRIAATARRIAETTGASVRGAAVDVTDATQIDRWVDDTAQRLGGIDVLVANAGGPPAARFDATTPEDWDRAYRLTLRSAMAFAASARPHLARGSAFLLMTSSSVREPISVLSMSTVFRSGVSALAKLLSDDWAVDGIRVNHLIPGRIHTARVEELDLRTAGDRGIPVEDVRASFEARIPLGRYGTPGEFAAAAAFLVSPAASYITGATLQVDGGMIRAVM
jgi:3-oxoacyl-[acyl-carrier protein] reductase